MLVSRVSVQPEGQLTPSSVLRLYSIRFPLVRTKAYRSPSVRTAEGATGETSVPESTRGGVAEALIRPTTSLPLPFELVKYRAPSGPYCTVRIRPYGLTSPSEAVLTTLVSGLRKSSLMPWPLSSATATAPCQRPQAESVRNVSPLVATVGNPDFHLAGWAAGNLVRSVIGTPSLYPGPGSQP